MLNFEEIEKKWQESWKEKQAFQANPDKRKKFFVNFPYPYINAYLHLGHAFSAARVDMLARFKRMQGFNVLFPQAWHCTGTPVWAASQRIKEEEPKQMQIMKSMGFSDGEIKKFENARHWIDVFVPAAKEDFIKLGNSIDWRRSFITTELNPRYDKFIKWQFRKLKEKGYVIKGKHPVVWCPKDNTPVGDHDRAEGEGETTQEYSLLKFKFNDSFLIAATLRPETVFGETNFWVNPDIYYVRAKVNNESWIISRECAEKLKNQDRKVEILEEINGKYLIGKYCTAPLINRQLVILPARFANPKIGTGLVTSVPSDAPYDYIALKELQEDEDEAEKYGLKPDELASIKPIPIIESKELGEMPAVAIVEKMKIKSQDDTKLDEATQIVYKAGFYSGKMNKNCGAYAGMPVAEAKERMKKDLAELGLIEPFYELTGKVVCRCLTNAVAKIVSDQWFLKYGDEKWKEETRTALSNTTLYPEITRQQFNYVIGWLNDWACTHHYGLGTRLPWDEKWLIESLSDSTIYMAYYTIAHLIEKIDVNAIDDEMFDYIFLGMGSGRKEWNDMKKEFEYWYPFDLRSSGKDLIQNHLAFCLFNHAAIFPPKYWPRAFGVNGWLLVENEKMSKSKGNFFTIRDMLKKYPADVVRASLILGGEGMDDPNFNFENAESIRQKLVQLNDFIAENYKEAKANETIKSDLAFVSAINKNLKEGTEAMEKMLFRTAFDKLYYHMQKALKSYLKKGRVNQYAINEFIKIQVRTLSPFCPHIAEELWHIMGNEEFVSLAEWPKHDESKIDEGLEMLELMAENTAKDINAVLKLVKTTPSKITIIVAEKWKYGFVKMLKQDLEKTRDIKTLMAKSIDEQHKSESAKIVQSAVKNPSIIPAAITGQDDEYAVLFDAKDLLSKDFGLLVMVEKAEQSSHEKAKNAMPGKPAIVVS